MDNKFTMEDIIRDQLIKVDKEYITVDLNDSFTAVHNDGGVYIFESEDGSPLYVGITDNVGRRISSHINGWGNQDIYNYNTDLLTVKYFKEEDKLIRDMYESYLIHTLKPRYNVSKTNRQKYNVINKGGISNVK